MATAIGLHRTYLCTLHGVERSYAQDMGDASGGGGGRGRGSCHAPSCPHMPPCTKNIYPVGTCPLPLCYWLCPHTAKILVPPMALGTQRPKFFTHVISIFQLFDRVLQYFVDLIDNNPAFYPHVCLRGPFRDIEGLSSCVIFCV